jgi:hypothetical protein
VTLAGPALKLPPCSGLYATEAVTDKNGEFSFWSPRPTGGLTISASAGSGWYAHDLMSDDAIPLKVGDDHVTIKITAR